MYITTDTHIELNMYVPDWVAKKHYLGDPEGGATEDELFWELLTDEQEKRIKDILWQRFRDSTDYDAKPDEDERWLNGNII